MSTGELRNKPCKCGSGKKYKKCCLPLEEGFIKEEKDGKVSYVCPHRTWFKMMKVTKDGVPEQVGRKCGKCHKKEMFAPKYEIKNITNR
jgi:hypothetical protein